ncbi:DUF4376 domain-containing protein [Campylobacter sp. RM16187]|uniref:DUF4376 domain-containing protein n=1 Tax=Campylobacter sp. RM16187 TaxID=1660063 RepID=UPI0021B5A21F|nr:hypothetical protein [Campylobacter sp. RM16187]QKG29197.1 hypothetical protein CDOMF_0934 [Campylobacter sp. RM16187]
MQYKEIKNKTIYYEDRGETKALSINPQTDKPFSSDDEAWFFAEITSELNPMLLSEANSFKASIEGRKGYLKGVLTSKFNEAVSKSKVYVDGIGDVDAGVQYLINVMTLIDLCGKSGTIAFRMFDNTSKNLDLAQLKAVKTAIQTKGINLYSKKWQLEKMIEDAKDETELNAVNIDFGE